MAYENKPNTGAAFKNENKTTDNHPDYTGTFYDKDGVKMNVAIWLNESKAGKKYFSIAHSEWRESVKTDSPAPAAAATDDDLPF